MKKILFHFIEATNNRTRFGNFFGEFFPSLEWDGKCLGLNEQLVHRPIKRCLVWWGDFLTSALGKHASRRRRLSL
jgi:hypothetical protein